MPSSKDYGEILVGCLKEVSALLEHANGISMKQRDALVKKDAEGITVTSAAHDEILRRIDEADQRAADIASELAKSAGLDPENSAKDEVAEAAGFPYSSLIMSEMDKISSLAESLKKANEINKCLIKNGIEIITCCLRTIADDPGPSSYSKDASMQSSSQSHVLSLDLRV